MELWCPFAVRRDGPAWKVGYSPPLGMTAPKRGEIKHSAEGGWAGLYSVLDGTRPASWHFTVGYDRIEQHYPLNVNTWHGNDTDDDDAIKANLDTVGVEHLGKAGEPLDAYQLDATVRLSAWMAQQFGFSRFDRFPVQDGVWTLAEHRQLGNTPTACPSDRIPWDEVLRRLQLPPQQPYVTGLRIHFSDGTEWNVEAVKPPDRR